MVQDPGGSKRIRAVRRDGGQVTHLELFFDLVFVLTLTQCSILIVDRPTWAGVGQGLLVLGLLWWTWVGYAWLTSVVDPEAGAVRLVMFVAMAAFLVAALAVPEAFGDDGMVLAIAFGVVRVAHIALFLLASRDEPDLRRSVWGLTWSTVLAIALVVGGAFASGGVRELLWLLALVLDMGGPFFFGADGWQLVPTHFAERHGLVIIIALGESVIAIGIGAGVTLTADVIIGAVAGMFLAAALWWLYFDVASIMAERRLAALPPGRDRNALARDAYSYLHLPMVGGVVLAAFGIEATLAHVNEPLHLEPAVALGGGVALYLLALVAFKRRAVGLWSIHRVAAAVVLLALIPVWHSVDAIVALVGVVAAVVALILYESVRFAEMRNQERRHQPEHGD